MSRRGVPGGTDPLDEASAWALLRGLRRIGRGGLTLPAGLAFDSARPDVPVVRPAGDPAAALTIAAAEDWHGRVDMTPAAARLIDLYLPVCLASAWAPLTVGHLGQSLDGFVATASGASHYVTGEENIIHLHRMRALSDAVLVGAATVRLDDPQLTARRVPGDQPTRVIVDPERRLAPDHRVFKDGAAPTVVICAAHCAEAARDRSRAVEAIGVPAGPDGLAPGEILAALHRRGLHAVFVEGGGVTVSRFLAAGRLDRLQIAVAPLVIGAGRPGLAVPPAASLGEALRPRCRHFVMGQDVLFDCALR